MFDQFLSKAAEMLASGQSFAIAEVVHFLKPVSEIGGQGHHHSRWRTLGLDRRWLRAACGREGSPEGSQGWASAIGARQHIVRRGGRRGGLQHVLS